MGVKFVGGSTYWRSIGQNLLPMKNKFGFSNGYFGMNDGKSSNWVRTITTEDPIGQAKSFFSCLTYGGIDISTKEITRIKTHDGSIVTMRLKTSSVDSPAVDINIRNSSHTGGIKYQKVHFTVPKEY